MPKILLLILTISLLTCSVEIDMSVPSFPDISDYFGISDGLTQMTIAINSFGFFLSSVFYGPLSDAFGRRKIMLIGNSIMFMGALGCVLANSIEVLLISRLIQGFGASTSAVIVFAIIADVCSASRATKSIGIMNSLITVFMSIAPVAGAFINKEIGWRGNYAAVASISAISLGMLYFYLPETKKEFKKIDSKKTLNDFKILFSSSKFILASFVPSIFTAGWLSFVSCAAFLYMETYGLPIMEYAIHIFVMIAAFSVVSMFSGNISQIIGEVNSVFYGSFLSFFGGVMIVTVSMFSGQGITPITISNLTTLSVVIYATGSAVSYPVVFARSLEIFPQISGVASSAIMAMRSLICAVVIAISSYLYQGSLGSVAIMLLILAILGLVASLKLIKLHLFVTTHVD